MIDVTKPVIRCAPYGLRLLRPLAIVFVATVLLGKTVAAQAKKGQRIIGALDELLMGTSA